MPTQQYFPSDPPTDLPPELTSYITDELRRIAEAYNLNEENSQSLESRIADLENDLANLEAVPSGTIAFFGMSTPPSGWLKADGSAVSRTTYANLFAAIGTTFGVGDGATTFNVPDLRGEFVRGWDDGRGVDSGRVFGSAQSDAFKSHNHSVSDPGHRHHINVRFFNLGAPSGSTVYDGGGSSSRQDPTTTVGTGISIGNNGGTETRPRNVALLACIKY